MPELRDLALEKFTKDQQDKKWLPTQQLIHLAATVYANTPKSAVDLRTQLLALVCGRSFESFDDPEFMQALAEEPGLQESASDLLFQTVKRNRAQEAILAAEIIEERKKEAATGQKLKDVNARLSAVEKNLATKRLLHDGDKEELEALHNVAQLKKCPHCDSGHSAKVRSEERLFSYTLVNSGLWWAAKCATCGENTAFEY